MKERWLRRLGSPRSGFRYVDPDGRAIGDLRVLTRIESLPNVLEALRTKPG